MRHEVVLMQCSSCGLEVEALCGPGPEPLPSLRCPVCEVMLEGDF